jgi:hypothetical protein
MRVTNGESPRTCRCDRFCSSCGCVVCSQGCFGRCGQEFGVGQKAGSKSKRSRSKLKLVESGERRVEKGWGG